MFVHAVEQLRWIILNSECFLLGLSLWFCGVYIYSVFIGVFQRILKMATSHVTWPGHMTGGSRVNGIF